LIAGEWHLQNLPQLHFGENVSNSLKSSVNNETFQS
jgi:hypothetical protein